MILNPFALTSIFTGIVSLLLIAGAAISALYFHRQMKHSVGPDERARAEIRIHFSLLLLFTAFVLRLIAWPLFYILLQSLIPIVPGAMCIYGVTQVMPALISFIQLFKPMAFFLIGGWLLFYGLDLSLKNHSLMEQSIRLLVSAAVFAAVDGVAEILFIFLFSPPGVAVSCCTVVADIVLPAVPLLPVPLLRSQYHGILMIGYHGFNLLLAGGIIVSAWRKNAGRLWLTVIAITALINCLITYAAFKEYIGPRLMRLPDHHCLYCMLQYRPVSIIIVGLFVLGSFCAIWPRWLNRTVVADESGEHLSSLNLALLKCAAVCLFASWLMAILLQ
jgi:hypothetical protein